MLLGLSAFFYTLHYIIFRDLHHIVFYLITDLGFLFLNVFIVMLFLQSFLNYREKQSILKKLNMVIGSFFSEVGTELINSCSSIDQDIAKLREQLIITQQWTIQDFDRAYQKTVKHAGRINCRANNLVELKQYLLTKRPFLLALLENPNLLEHDTFTDVLWAVFHLTDELAHRQDFSQLPETDYQHLNGDITRVYQHLIGEWLNYMKHLKQDYPYLFSLAVRNNPFDQNASIIVR
jgi:hypothetical protein